MIYNRETANVKIHHWPFTIDDYGQQQQTLTLNHPLVL